MPPACSVVSLSQQELLLLEAQFRAEEAQEEWQLRQDTAKLLANATSNGVAPVLKSRFSKSERPVSLVRKPEIEEKIDELEQPRSTGPSQYKLSVL